MLILFVGSRIAPAAEGVPPGYAWPPEGGKRIYGSVVELFSGARSSTAAPATRANTASPYIESLRGPMPAICPRSSVLPGRLSASAVSVASVKTTYAGTFWAVATRIPYPLEKLTPAVKDEIARASERTAANTGMILSVALNYGGRAEIVDACRQAIRKLDAEGKSADDLTESDIQAGLYTHGLPELDLLVRTSGEFRISNFLLWQSAYAEIHVTETLWPDFRRAQLLEAIIDYQQRRRRFGGLKLVVNAK